MSASKPNPMYNAGYNKAISNMKHFDDKYSQMWCEANRWQIPSKLHLPNPSRSDTRETMFISGVWSILEALRKDAIISDKTIDKFWKQQGRG